MVGILNSENSILKWTQKDQKELAAGLLIRVKLVNYKSIINDSELFNVRN